MKSPYSAYCSPALNASKLTPSRIEEILSMQKKPIEWAAFFSVINSLSVSSVQVKTEDVEKL